MGRRPVGLSVALNETVPQDHNLKPRLQTCITVYVLSGSYSKRKFHVDASYNFILLKKISMRRFLTIIPFRVHYYYCSRSSSRSSSSK